MLQDVNVKIEDGGLGVVPSGPDGIHVKIGVAGAGATPLSVVTMTSGASNTDIVNAFGHSPLADAVMDSLQAGSSTVYCIPIAGAVAGTIGTVSESKTGEATMVASGSPLKAFEVVLEVLSAGAFNEATYKLSTDGGDNYLPEMTIPIGGVIDIGNTGVTLTFTEAATAADSFKVGDTYAFKTTAPSASNAEVLDALAVAKELMYEFEFIHIVGESGSVMWAAVAAEMDSFLADKFMPIFAICEARNIDPGESLDDYTQALLTERASVNSYRLQVVATRGELSARDGSVRDTNLAGTVCGLYASGSVAESIGEVRRVSLSAVTALKPDGIDKHIATLDDAGYLTARRYVGLSGFYVTNARLFAGPTSDYQNAEVLRPMNKLVSLTRLQGLSQMQIQIDPTNVTGSLKLLEEFLSVPGEDMVAAGELSAVKITIPTDQNVLGTSSLDMDIDATPMATLKNINQTFKLNNPFR